MRHELQSNVRSNVAELHKLQSNMRGDIASRSRHAEAARQELHRSIEQTGHDQAYLSNVTWGWIFPEGDDESTTSRIMYSKHPTSGEKAKISVPT